MVEGGTMKIGGEQYANLTPAERETNIQYDEEQNQFVIYSVVRRHITRLTKIFGKGELVDQFGTRRWVVGRLPALTSRAPQKTGSR